MAVDITVLSNGVEFEGSGREVLDGLITRTIDQTDLVENHKQYKALLDITDTALLNPDQKFSSRIPNAGLQTITERGIKPTRDHKFWPKKGISQREVGAKFTTSYLMTQWARKGQNLKDAPDSIQAELITVRNDSKDLVMGYDITYAEEMVKVLTLGFSVTTIAPDGTTNACARDGLSLFNASHELLDGTTFSNIVTGTAYTDVATGATKLTDAINKLKGMKFDNGKKVMQNKSPYKLYCSRLRETFWLEVINNGSDKAGTGNNSAKENIFSFRNNLVQVIVIDLLGDVDADGNTIGSNDMWFLTNPTAIKKMEAIRCAELYTPRVKTWENDETDEINTSIRAIVGANHYDAEFAIVGSTGA